MAKASKTAPAPAPFQTGEQDYVVTEKAPEKVAGRHVQPGDTIRLTDEQARYDEQARHIRKAAPAAPSSGE